MAPSLLASAPSLAPLATSRLGRMGGFAIARLLSDTGVRLLAEEAFRRHESGTVAAVTHATPEESACGNPNRALDTAPGGDRLNSFYRSQRVLRFLRDVSGISWQRTGDHGSYSYYHQIGHYLGLHRDIEECGLALVTCLYDHEEHPDENRVAPGGALVLYPTRQHEALDRIQESLDTGAVPIRLRPGQSLILLGGLVPHYLSPVAGGHTRIVAPLCFTPAGMPMAE